MMEGERGVIIAMQGDPCTGKTAIANILGRRLKCTTIRFDDILEFVAPGLESPQPPKKLDALLTQAFDLLTQIAKTQTCLGMSVVVDSPLSRRSHLDRLVELVTGPCGKDQEEAAAVRLIIVQCKPETRYMWEAELSSQLGGSRYKNKWYKPQSCPIENEFARDYDDDKHIPARARLVVSKLVVKTSSHVPPPDPLAAAVDYLIRAREAREVDFQAWLRAHDISPPRYKEARKLGLLYNDEPSTHQKRPLKRIKVLTEFCRDGHCVNEYHEQGTYRLYSRTCEVCDEKIVPDSSSVYTCNKCPMAIHTPCAELQGKGSNTGFSFTPQEFPKFLHKSSYCFPEQHSCLLCTKEKKEFSYDCGSCIFKTHLKCGLLPTILRHKAHAQHWLYFWVSPISTASSYECTACRKLTNSVGFSCVDGCVIYHPECAFLPRDFQKHEHGGYKHDLSLLFHRQEKLEDYICNLCLETMNPDAWYYSCTQCPLELHLDCAFKEFY